MPPLPPNLSQAGLLRSKSGWNNSSLSRRSNTIRGLLSTRTPQSTGNSGGGIPNPSLGIGVISEAMPKGATGSWVPRPISLARPVGPVVATITVGEAPSVLALDAGNNRLYVVNSGTGTVSVINTTSQAVISTINVGILPQGLALDADNDRLYVANTGGFEGEVWGTTVTAINTTNYADISTINVGEAPFALALDADNDRLYVSNVLAGTVSVIDTTRV